MPSDSNMYTNILMCSQKEATLIHAIFLSMLAYKNIVKTSLCFLFIAYTRTSYNRKQKSKP